MNIIAKGVKGREYIITDMMATRLTKSQFEKVQQLNPELLKDYRFIPQAETDFSWWSRISTKLTRTKIKPAWFTCDFNGNVEEF